MILFGVPTIAIALTWTPVEKGGKTTMFPASTNGCPLTLKSTEILPWSKGRAHSKPIAFKMARETKSPLNLQKADSRKNCEESLTTTKSPYGMVRYKMSK